SAEKTETSPIVEVLKPVAKRSEKNRRKERWPKDPALEQEVIEPAEVRDNHRALDGRPLLLAGASNSDMNSPCLVFRKTVNLVSNICQSAIYPYLTGRRGRGRRLCLSDSWDGRTFSDVFLVGFDPV